MKLLIVFLLIHSRISTSIGKQERCSVCDLNGFYTASNGYYCLLTDGDVRCTCPDKILSKLNRPCRICERDGICNGLCSEESAIFQSNRTSHFACFCRSGSYLIGESCPKETTLPPASSPPPLITTTTTINSSNETISNDSTLKSLIVNPLLIILVYLINI